MAPLAFLTLSLINVIWCRIRITRVHNRMNACQDRPQCIHAAVQALCFASALLQCYSRRSSSVARGIHLLLQLRHTLSLGLQLLRRWTIHGTVLLLLLLLSARACGLCACVRALCNCQLALRVLESAPCRDEVLQWPHIVS